MSNDNVDLDPVKPKEEKKEEKRKPRAVRRKRENLYGLDPAVVKKNDNEPKNLFNMDPEELQKMIEEALKGRNNSYDYYGYFILTESMLLVKIAEYNIIFNVKMRLNGDKLEIVEVS